MKGILKFSMRHERRNLVCDMKGILKSTAKILLELDNFGHTKLQKMHTTCGWFFYGSFLATSIGQGVDLFETPFQKFKH